MKPLRFLLPLLLPVAIAGCAAEAPPRVEAALPLSTEGPPSGSAVVSAADPRAAAAGRAMLARGGNAVDAAMAMMLALTVVEPQSSGIGGGGFVMFHPAGGTRPHFFDGREMAPSSARPDMFLGPDGKLVDSEDARTGGRATGVPGNIRLAAKVHARHGKLKWSELFGPAIAFAREGFALTPRGQGAIAGERELLLLSDEARALYLEADGSPKAVGTIIRNPALAALYERIAREGPDAFYRGQAAQDLSRTVGTSRRNPVVMTVADIARYEAKERAPICGKYRGYTVCGAAPPSSGGIGVLAILKQIERFDIAGLGARNPKAWHLIAESMRLAYADRARWIADPDFVPVPTAGLTEDRYFAARSALISPDRAASRADAGRPAGAPPAGSVPDTELSGTTHMSVADAAGNVVAYTSTIEAGFGSGLVSNGYMLNNELTDFDRQPSAGGMLAMNRVQAGKRPRSSMSPTIVYDPSGRPIVAIGAAGGPTIIAQVAKTVIGVIDWKLPIQEAIALPQIMGSGNVVRVQENTWLAAMADQLRSYGHDVRVGRFGTKLNGVERISGGWRGGADPQSEGRALGYTPGR